ncbi:MAG: HEAT repeat domain-containing protein [Bacteroidetes bacterium]|nr:HEAT repeat domain-containing protein [Bacteroidota bacterium]MBK9670878.1 HEAT repeat domain-containing protein [Bacteroidota bacterium]MBK9801219.1 HEAT repeat domain-containing protein [Bacteroidota bacterium]
MLTKEYIKDLKSNGNGAIGHLVKDYKDSGNLTFILENLGQLPKDFDGSFLPELLTHKNPSVRLWTVKTFGKLDKEEYLTTLKETALNDSDTTVRREAVSSIGRMRSKKGQDILFEILKDKDPKIISQAIRGLLVFKGEPVVDEQLKALINHENEMVRTVIYKEYFSEVKDKNSQPHTESFDYLKNIVVNGDNIEVMKLLKDESIHLTFTSPPYYNARDYSIYPSYKHYLEFLAEVFREVHRITKEGRFLIVNTSPIIIPRISRSHSSKRYPIPFDIHPYLMEMGWDFIDDIVWLKPEASVKNRIGGFMQHRKPLGYKPNSVTEYLMVYRKNTEKLLDWNIREYDWNTILESKVADGYETTNVWRIDPCFDKVHSAVFPVELCKRVIQYYSYKGDLVFDPFGGSGTMGKTAKKLDRYFLLTEKDETYFEYMQSKKTKEMFDTFDTKFLTHDKFKDTIK